MAGNLPPVNEIAGLVASIATGVILTAITILSRINKDKPKPNGANGTATRAVAAALADCLAEIERLKEEWTKERALLYEQMGSLRQQIESLQRSSRELTADNEQLQKEADSLIARESELEEEIKRLRGQSSNG